MYHKWPSITNKRIEKFIKKNISFFLMLLIFIIIMSFIIYFFYMPYYISFYSVKEDRIIKEVKVKPEDKFTISYIHSYNKTPVSETFLIAKNKEIVLKETEYSWQGVGLQDTCPIRGTWGYQNGNVYISEINSKLKNIPLRVGMIANHQFVYNDKILPFESFAKRGELIILTVNRHWW